MSFGVFMKLKYYVLMHQMIEVQCYGRPSNVQLLVHVFFCDWTINHSTTDFIQILYINYFLWSYDSLLCLKDSFFFIYGSVIRESIWIKQLWYIENQRFLLWIKQRLVAAPTKLNYKGCKNVVCKTKYALPASTLTIR